jgi:alkylated DNA repair dioxygenase AlkB
MRILNDIEQDSSNCVFIQIDNFLNDSEIKLYQEKVINIDDWKKGIFNNNKTPRLQKWFQDDNKYFSNKWINQSHERWMSNLSDDWLFELRNKIQEKTNELFEYIIDLNLTGCNKPKLNSSLINYYRDGNDYIKYHRDDESIFGDNPTICMLTFGTERELKFKRIHKNEFTNTVNLNNSDESLNKSFVIKPGSLFIMMGSVQKYYCHGIEKDSTIFEPRYSLTFREHKNVL